MAPKPLPRIKNLNDMCDTYDTNDTLLCVYFPTLLRATKSKFFREIFGSMKKKSYLCTRFYALIVNNIE